jgi:hypothetical protein
MRLPLTIKPWRCLNLPGPLCRIAPESHLIGGCLRGQRNRRTIPRRFPLATLPAFGEVAAFFFRAFFFAAIRLSPHFPEQCVPAFFDA